MSDTNYNLTRISKNLFIDLRKISVIHSRASIKPDGFYEMVCDGQRVSLNHRDYITICELKGMVPIRFPGSEFETGRLTDQKELAKRLKELDDKGLDETGNKRRPLAKGL